MLGKTRKKAGIESLPKNASSKETPRRSLLRTRTETPTKRRRKKQIWDEHIMKLLLGFYTPSSIHKCPAQPSFTIWRRKKPTKRVYFTEKTFGNVRRDIFKKESFTEVDLDTTEEWGIQYNNNISQLYYTTIVSNKKRRQTQTQRQGLAHALCHSVYIYILKMCYVFKTGPFLL